MRQNISTNSTNAQCHGGPRVNIPQQCRYILHQHTKDLTIKPTKIVPQHTPGTRYAVAVHSRFTRISSILSQYLKGSLSPRGTILLLSRTGISVSGRVHLLDNVHIQFTFLWPRNFLEHRLDRLIMFLYIDCNCLSASYLASSGSTFFPVSSLANMLLQCAQDTLCCFWVMF